MKGNINILKRKCSVYQSEKNDEASRFDIYTQPVILVDIKRSRNKLKKNNLRF